MYIHTYIPPRPTPFHYSGLDNATDIVVSGCSAGAVQTYINLDYIKTLMPKTAHVVGLPDSGCVFYCWVGLGRGGCFSGIGWFGMCVLTYTYIYSFLAAYEGPGACQYQGKYAIPCFSNPIALYTM